MYIATTDKDLTKFTPSSAEESRSSPDLGPNAMCCRFSESGIWKFFSKYRPAAVLLPLLALLVGAGTMMGCVAMSIAAAKPGTTLPPWYAQDISSWGFNPPNVYLFGSGFTVLSFLVILLIFLRAGHTEAVLTIDTFGKINFWIGVAHFPPIVLMAWTDANWWGLKAHFPAAILGLGILSIYCFLHMIQAWIMVKYYNGKRRIIAICASFWYTIACLFPPLGVGLWISLQDPMWEWIAVISLFGYFVPYLIELWYLEPLSDDLSAVVPLLSDDSAARY